MKEQTIKLLEEKLNIKIEEFISTVIHDAINFGQFSEDFKAGKLKDYNMSYQKYQEY